MPLLPFLPAIWRSNMASRAMYSAMTQFLFRYWSLSPLVASVCVVVRVVCTVIDVFVPLATGWLLDAVVGAEGIGSHEAIWRELTVFLLLVVMFICCRNGLTLLTNRISSLAIVGWQLNVRMQKLFSRLAP